MSCRIEYKGNSIPLDKFLDSIDNLLANENKGLIDMAIEVEGDNPSTSVALVSDDKLKNRDFNLDNVNLQKDYTFITNVPTNIQYNLINYISTNVINYALDNPNNVISIETAVADALNRLHNRRAVVEKMTSKNKERVLEILDTLLDNEDTLVKRVTSIIAKAGTLKVANALDIELANTNKQNQETAEDSDNLDYDLDSNETTLDKEGVEDAEDTANYNDDSVYKANPMDKLSEKNRALLKSIRNGKIKIDKNTKQPILDDKGNFILEPTFNIVTGFDGYVPMNQIYGTLIGLLSTTNNQYVAPNIDSYLTILKNNIRTKPYLIDVVNALENATESQKMAFISNFSNQYSHSEFLNIKRNKDNNVEHRITKSDQRDNANSAISTWNNEIRLGDSLTNVGGKLTVKQPIKDYLVKQANYLAHLSTNITKEYIDSFFKPLGITISEPVFKALSLYGFRNKTLKESFDINQQGGFGLMAELVSLSDSFEDNNFFTDSVFSDLAKIIAEYSETTTVSSFRSITGDMHYAYTKPRKIVDDIAKAKHDVQFLKDKVNSPFSAITTSSVNDSNFMQGSWLKELLTLDDNGEYVINKDSTISKVLKYSTPEGIKTIYNKGKQVKRLDSLEYESFKLNNFINNRDSKDNKPVHKFIGLTMSDKSTPVVITAPGIPVSVLYKDGNPIMREDRLLQEDKHYNGRVEKAGTLISKGDDTILYEAMVLPEINRMLFHRNMLQNKQRTNVHGFDTGGNRFYTFPELNSIDYLFETSPKTGIIQTRTIKADILTDPKAIVLIKKAINNSLMQELESKKLKWLDLGILTANINDTFDISSIDKDNILSGSRSEIDNFIYNYIFNYRLANFNMQQLFIGDPTLFYSDKGLRGIKKSIDKIKNKEVITDEQKQELSKLEFNYNNAYTKGVILESFDNQGKRLAADNASGSKLVTESPTVKFWIMPDVEKDSSVIKYLGTLLGDKELNNYKGINTADAQEYTTLREHLRWLYAEDKISKDTMDRLNNQYDNDEDIDWKAYEAEGVILAPRKPMYKADFIRSDGDIALYSRLYVKSSAVPLIKGFTKGMELDKIRQYMEDNNIDRAAYESAVKVGLPSPDVLAKGDYVIEVPREGHVIQQDVPFNEDKKYINDGTQKSNLLYVNLMEVEGFIDPISGETVKGRKHYEGYAKQYEELFKYKYNKLIKEVGFNPETKTVDFKKLSKRLIKEGINRGFSENELLQLELNDKGQFRVPLWLSSNDGKIQSLLNSIVDNGIRKRKPRGKSYVLLSDNGVGSDLNNNDITWIADPVTELKPIRESNGTIIGGQILVPFDVFDQNGNRLNIEDYLTTNERGKKVFDTSKIDLSILEAFGFRIPTQDMGSMHAFEIVGFLPTYMKDSVIAPKELVAQMGSDFDVDKLYNYLFNIYKDSEGNLTKITAKNFEVLQNESSIDLTQHLLENNILEYSLAVMKNPNPIVQKQIYTPIDNAEYLRGLEIASELSALQDSSNYNYYSEDFQSYKYKNAIVGKDAVGSFALDTVFNAVIQYVDDNINFSKNIEGSIDVDYVYLYDKKGNKLNNPKTLDKVTNKSDVIKALLSMAVDNEKLQVLGTLNINNNTFDFIRAAVFGGYNIEQIVTFLNHPSIKKYIEEKSINKGTYFASVLDSFDSSDKGKSPVFTFEEVKSRIGTTVENIPASEALAVINQFLNTEEKGKVIKSAQSAINTDSSGIGKNIFESSNKQSRIVNLPDNNMFNIEQVIGDYVYLNTNAEYREMSKAEQEAYEKDLVDKGYVKVNSSVELNNDGIHIDKGNIYIKPKGIKGTASIYATLFNNELWDNVMPYNRAKFKTIYHEIKRRINTSTKDLLTSSSKEEAQFQKTIAEHLKSYLFSHNVLLAGGYGNVIEAREDLLLDSPTNKSLAVFLHELKSSNKLSNRLLSRLEVDINNINTSGVIPNRIKYNAASAESIDEDLIVQSIIDLLESKSVIGERNGKEVTGFTLMRDLINYQIVTGGIQKANQFIKHIPVAYYEALGVYTNSVSNYRNLESTEAFVTQYIQHNPEQFAVQSKRSDIGSNIINSSTEDSHLFDNKDLVVIQGVTNEPFIYKRIDPNKSIFVKLDKLGYEGLNEYDFTNKIGKTSVYVQSSDQDTVDSIFNNNNDSTRIDSVRLAFNIPSKNIVPFTLKSKEDTTLDIGAIIDVKDGEHIVIGKTGNILTVYDTKNQVKYEANSDNVRSYGRYYPTTLDSYSYLVLDNGTILDTIQKTEYNRFDKERISQEAFKGILPSVELPISNSYADINNALSLQVDSESFEPVINDINEEASDVKYFKLDTNNAQYILTMVANNLSNPITRYVTQQMLTKHQAFKNVDIIIDNNLKAKGVVTYDASKTRPVTIRFNPSKIKNREDFANVINEEFLHALTIQSMDKNPEIAERVKDLHSKVKSLVIKKYAKEYSQMEAKLIAGLPLKAGIEYDLLYSVYNTQEFLNSAISNKKFQDYLNNIDAKSLKSQSIWKDFVEMILNVLESFGIIKNRALEVAVHEVLNLIDQLPVNEVENIKDYYKDRGALIKSREDIQDNLGLVDSDGKMIPVGNSFEVATFINNYVENIIAVNSGPYVYIDYTDNVRITKPSRLINSFDEAINYSKKVNPVANEYPTGTLVNYKGKQYTVRGFDSNGRILLSELNGKPKSGGGINVDNISKVNNTTNQQQLDLSPVLEEHEDDYDYLAENEAAMSEYDKFIEAMSDEEYNEYVSSNRYKNKLYMQTLKDRAYDLQKVLDNIRAEKPKTAKDINDKQIRLHKAYSDLADLRQVEKSISNGLYMKDDRPLSIPELANKGRMELESIRTLLTKPLTDTHIIYALRVANFWKRSRDIMFTVEDRANPVLNDIFVSLEDEANNVRMEILRITHESLNKGLLKETLGKDITFDDIMNNYVAKGMITGQVSDLSTMGNSVLSAASITLKNTEIETRKELEELFKDFDTLVTKGYRKMKAMSSNGNPYDIFLQKKPNGKHSNRLASRYSHTYHKEWSKNRNKFFRGKNTLNAVKDLITWTHNNTEDIDLKSIFPVDGIITDEVKTNREALKYKLGTNAYNEYMLAQGKKIDAYNLAKSGMELTVAEQYGVNIEDVKNHIRNSTDTSVEGFPDNTKNAIAEYKRWAKTNNPYIFKSLVKESIDYGYYNNLEYLELIPNSSKSEYFDEAFKRIESDNNVYELYNMFKKTYDLLFSYLTPEQKRDISYNGLVEIPATILEQYSTKGLKLGIRPILDALNDMSTASEPYVNIDIASGEQETRMNLGFSRQGAKDILKEIERRTFKMLAETGKAPTEEQIEEWEEELQDSLTMDNTPDLGRHLKLYALAVIAFKHKSKIESTMKLVNQVMSTYTETMRNSKGEIIYDNLGRAKQKPTTSESFVQEKKVFDYSIGKLIYNAPNNRTLGEKTYTKREKEIIDDIDSTIDKIKRLQKGEGDNNNEAYKGLSQYLVNNNMTANEMINKLERQRNSIGKQVDYSKVGNMVLQYVQLKGMGWNIPGGISNVLFGTISNIIEGSGNRLYNNSDLLKAYKLAMHSVGRNLSFNSYKGIDQQAIKIRMAMDKLDILKDSSTEFQGSSYTNPIHKKLRFLSPYSINQRGEYLNQAPIMLAMAMKQQYKLEDGTSISLWEGFDNEFNWNTEKYGEEPTAIINKFKIKVDQVIKLNHGNYDTMSPMMIKKSLGGRALLQFRTWMVDSYRNRFGDRHGRYDDILEITRKGRYISLYDAVRKSPKEASIAIIAETARKFIPNISLLSGTRQKLARASKLEGIDGIESVDIANIQSVATEIAMAMSIYVVLLGLSSIVGDLDDEELALYNFWSNQASRVRTDLLMYANPIEARKLIKDPFPFVGVIDDAFGIMNGTYDLVIGNDEYTTGVYRGDSKMVHKLGSSIPLVSGVYRAYRSASQTFD